jgi:hypothetical protein
MPNDIERFGQELAEYPAVAGVMREGGGEPFGPAVGFVGYVGHPDMDRQSVRDYATEIAAALEDLSRREPLFQLRKDGAELVDAIYEDLAKELDEEVRRCVVRVAERSTERYGVRRELTAQRRPGLTR